MTTAVERKESKVPQMLTAGSSQGPCPESSVWVGNDRVVPGCYVGALARPQRRLLMSTRYSRKGPMEIVGEERAKRRTGPGL